MSLFQVLRHELYGRGLHIGVTDGRKLQVVTIQAMYVIRNNDGGLCNHCFSGKAMSITYPECVFAALVTCMKFACAILSSVTCPTLHYFSTLSQNGTIF